MTNDKKAIAPAEEALPNPPMPGQTGSRAGTLELDGKLYAVTEI